MSEPRLVRGLLRGLTVLRALNETNYATALELSKQTGLPRSTVYRLLDTLMAAGYVGIGARRETYQLTIQVRALSDGFHDEAWVTEIAAPVLADLGRQIVWPTDIATFDRDAMVVRDTTHMSSPLSINREKAGFRPPVLHSSIGHAYLAFCPEPEREMILRNIAASDRPDAELAKNRDYVERLVAETRARGYGIREGGMSPKTGSIGVPVMWRGRPVAAINMHYILSALLLDEVVARYLGALQAAAAKIADGLTERGVNPLADSAVVSETGD